MYIYIYTQSPCGSPLLKSSFPPVHRPKFEIWRLSPGSVTDNADTRTPELTMFGFFLLRLFCEEKIGGRWFQQRSWDHGTHFGEDQT